MENFVIAIIVILLLVLMYYCQILAWESTDCVKYYFNLREKFGIPSLVRAHGVRAVMWTGLFTKLMLLDRQNKFIVATRPLPLFAGYDGIETDKEAEHYKLRQIYGLSDCISYNVFNNSVVTQMDSWKKTVVLHELLEMISRSEITLGEIKENNWFEKKELEYDFIKYQIEHPELLDPMS